MLQLLRRQTKSVIDTFTIGSMSRIQIIAEMLKILGDELVEAQNSSEGTTFGTFLSKRDVPLEVESDGYTTPKRRRRTSHSEYTPTIDIVELGKIESIADLKSFRSDTKNRFDEIKKKTKKGYFETNDEAEKQIIKAHSLSASILDRFPIKSKGFKASETAERTIKCIKYLAKEGNESEKRCLEILNKECKHKFKLNQTTFLKGNLSGTPDAISMKDNMIVDVAEFKQIAQTSKGSTTERNIKNQGKLQIQAYINILGLKSGHLIVDQGNAHTYCEVLEDRDFGRNLKNRLMFFNEMSNFIDK